VEELEERASSGRAEPRGDTTGHIIGAGPVGRYYKVLAGCFVTGSLFLGVLSCAFCSWILVLGSSFLGLRFIRRFVLGYSFLDTRSWTLVLGGVFLNSRS
jgi:hypothetical protein